MKKTNLILIAILLFAFNSKAQKTGKYTDNRDQKKYNIVKIGPQIWMAENLAFKAKKECWVYNLDENNLEKYGYLYTWSVANRICPQGWKLPSEKDVEELYKNLINEESKRYVVLMPGGSSGFEAVQGGKIAKGSLISKDKGKVGMYWLFDKHREPNKMKTMRIDSDGTKVSIGSQDKEDGLSVRCIKE